MSGFDPESAKPAPGSRGNSRQLPRNVPLAILWAIAVATAGGYVCGLALSQFQVIGGISLWGLGALAGYVGRKILGAPCRPVAWCLVVVCVAAFFFAEICWLRWETVQGEESWLAGAGHFLQFVREAPMPAFIGGLFTFMGALSAFQQTARRYRIVMIVDD